MSVFRDIYPVLNDADRCRAGYRASLRDQSWRIGLRAKVILGRGYVGEPGELVPQLRNDQAVEAPTR